jgi:uncharacterized protein GlcG (DUF336 family)
MAALIAWMLVVRVDELVKDGAKRSRLRRSSILDKIINTNRKAVQTIKAAFSAASHIFDANPQRPAYGRTLQKMAQHGARGGVPSMTTITMAQADRIIDAAIARGVELNCRPISVIVVEPGCKVKAFKKEDGASMVRFEMAFGKAYAALALGRSSSLVHQRAEERPIFMRYLIAASDEQLFAEAGGLLIRDADGEVIGAVGVTGDTGERDEELAAHGIHAAGLKTDEDCRDMGRRVGLLPKTN